MKILRNIIGTVVIAVIYFLIYKSVGMGGLVAAGFAAVVIGLANIEERIK